MIGTKLGHYEIVEPLGAGGMGEVYRARDTRLGRDVAVKLLAEDFAADAGRLSRLEREAQLLAALDHPNIATIHSFEHFDGLRFMVLELVRGETLARRIVAGPLKLDEALEIAVRIAEALEAAHGEGIVHRDLKPANVLIAPGGRVKVLDFGIAKSTEGAGAASRTGAATDLTVEGTLLGTPAYMSPEQIRGGDAGKRSDIWSFGCVLYEMLAGVPAFAADTLADTMAAIVEREPDWTRLPATTPESLRSLLRRCLQKDPRRRLHHVADARIEIDDVRRGREPPTTSAMETERSFRLVPAVVAAVVILVALVVGFFLRGALSPQAPPTSWQTVQITRSPYYESQPSLSPDGQSLVFTSDEAGNLDIWWRRVGGERAINLTDDCDQNDRSPAISPDGQLIVYRSECNGGGLFIRGVTGENLRPLLDHGHDPTWSPDGRSIAFAEVPVYSPDGLSIGGILRVDIDTPTDVVPVVDMGFLPTWSPNGHRIAFFSVSDGGQRDIYTVAIDGSLPVQLTDDEAFDWGPVWGPDGSRLYFASGRGGVRNLWSIEIDERSGVARGEPQQVQGSEAQQAWMSIAAGGSAIAYASVREPLNLQRVAFDPETGEIAGGPEPITRGTNRVFRFHVSPDGETVVFATQGGVQEDLFLIRADGTGEPRQLTDDPFRDREPYFVDDRRVAFYSDRSGAYQVWLIDLESFGLQQITEVEDGIAYQPVVSPDGDQLVYALETEDNEIPYLISLSTPWATQTPRPLLEPSNDAFRANSWSPNGRWIVGWSSPGVAPRTQVLTPATGELVDVGDLGGHAHPVWLTDDTIILTLDTSVRGVTTRRESLMIVDRATGTSRELLRDGVEWTFGEPVDVSRDGRWIYFIRTELESDIWLLQRMR